MKLSKQTLLGVLALVGTVTVLWCITNDRMSLQNWSVPMDYFDDCPLLFGHWQAAAEGDYTLFRSKELHRLGAPFVANWNDWPSPGKDQAYFYGVLTRWFGLFTTSNIAVLAAYITSALAFFAVCRLMRFRRLWAYMGAVLFAFTYIHAYRGLHHLLFTYSYMVPFAILGSWLIAFSRGMSWRDWRPWLCLVTAVVIGIDNPYHVNLYAQLICLALVVQFLSRRQKFNLVLGVGCMVVMVAAFFLINLDTFAYQFANGKNPAALTRGYYETEMFALKPTEMVLPPLTHQIDGLDELASAYVRDEAWFKGEMFSAYMGWVGIAALVWMTWEALLRLVKPRAYRSRFPAYVPLVLWVLVYCMIGGLNCIISFLTTPLFRGTNRYSIYISALALLFLVSRLSRYGARWPAGTRYVVAGVILLVGLFDELPRPTSHGETLAYERVVASDAAFGKALEAKLPPGAMVFQLPVVPFPEGLAVGGVQSYDMLRPYLHTRTLRFSFGSDKGRPREDWQKDVEKLPGAQLASTLEQYGFSAIYLNRKGFPDQGQALLKQLADAGRSDSVEDAGHEQVCVLLHPSPNPQVPPMSNRIPWLLKAGWAPVNSGPGGEVQNWGHGTSYLDFYAPIKGGPCSCTFKCQLGSLEQRNLTLEVNGREAWSGPIPGGSAVPVSVRMEAKPGRNVVAFKTDVRDLPSKRNPVPRGYVILNLQMFRNTD